jgi:hypothetical protein
VSGTNRAAPGPLVVSRRNPRYFTVRGEDGGGSDPSRAVLLTGSHINNNFQDGAGPGPDCAQTPEKTDFAKYLHFLTEHGHNFIRLWRWEHFRSQVGNGSFHMCMSPQPWPRTGPGDASDGRPKFDLSKFDDSYFSRLRDDVSAAGDRGIYVSVMLFEGFALHLSPPPDNVRGHPFHADNNVNDVGLRSIADYQVLPLHPRVRELQEAYIRRVIDTVHDLPNVLYEVANESSGDPGVGDSTEWQYWVIDRVRSHEKARGYDVHPIGMTMQYPVPDQRRVNAPLYASPADWISPGFDEPMDGAEQGQGQGPPPGRWLLDPPPNDGLKLVLSDTDHYSPFMADSLWAWRTFLRGHHPVLYDFGIIMGAEPGHPVPGLPPYEAYEATRHAMGDILRVAQRLDLLEMVPAPALSSTGFALARPGREYLILQPDREARSFTAKLAAGSYATEWYSVEARKLVAGEGLVVRDTDVVTIQAPFVPAVLHLRR